MTNIIVFYRDISDENAIKQPLLLQVPPLPSENTVHYTFISQANEKVIDLNPHHKRTGNTKMKAKIPSSDLAKFEAHWVLRQWARALRFVPTNDLANDLDTAIQFDVTRSTTSYENDCAEEDFQWNNAKLQSDYDMHIPFSQTNGTLIDLDHAKRANETMAVRKLDPPRTLVRRRFLDLTSSDFNFHVTEDAVLQALKFVPLTRLPIYFEDANKYNVMQSKSGEGDWTAEDFGWDDVEDQWNFDTHVPDIDTKRTGTIPFISHRLMKHVSDLDSHDAIHDMESLFWVIIHICLIRESGCGHREPDRLVRLRKPEKSGTPETETPEERSKREEREKREKRDKRKQYISHLFFSHQDAISSYKGIHIQSDSEVSIDNLLAHIHDYFSPFKDMLKRWRNVLVLGYSYKAYEYYHVHEYLLKIVDDTLRHPDVLVEAQSTDHLGGDM